MSHPSRHGPTAHTRVHALAPLRWCTHLTVACARLRVVQAWPTAVFRYYQHPCVLALFPSLWPHASWSPPLCGNRKVDPPPRSLER